MVVDINEITFENDFAYINCANGSVLVLNKLDEDIVEGQGEAVIKNINIALVDIDDNYIRCNLAIGMENEYIKLYSEYKELEGKVLTVDNMSLCKIEVFDE